MKTDLSLKKWKSKTKIIEEAMMISMKAVRKKKILDITISTKNLKNNRMTEILKVLMKNSILIKLMRTLMKRDQREELSPSKIGEMKWML